MNTEFNGKGFKDIHFGEWRLQLHYPTIDFVCTPYEKTLLSCLKTHFGTDVYIESIRMAPRIHILR
jgi:hypothetical protein